MNSRAVQTANSVRSIAPTQDAGVAPWGDMYHQADALVKSGFLPAAIKTPEQAIAVILTGDELGLPKMLALRSIHIVQGRPTLSADLMASLVLREIDRHRDGLLMVQPPTAEACTVRFRRWGWPEEQSYTYTIADAQRAGLAGKETWKQHPAAMLRARATASVCRMAFPDVVAGLYAIGEIQEGDGEAGDLFPSGERPQSMPRVDVVEAHAQGERDRVDAMQAGAIDVDYATGEITGQQTLPDKPVNGTDMITKAQADRITALRDVIWPEERFNRTEQRDALKHVAGEVTGITNPQLLSAYRASDLIDHLEAMAREAEQAE